MFSGSRLYYRAFCGSPYIVPSIKSDNSVIIFSEFNGTLNSVIEGTRRSLSKVEHLFTEHNNICYVLFSKIDLKDEYAPLELSYEVGS